MDVAVALAAAGWVLAAGLALAWWRARARAEQQAQAVRDALAGRAHLQEIVDALDIGLVVYDAQDRLLLWNTDFTGLYSAQAASLQVGLSFEQLLRHAVQRGQVPAAAGREEAWVRERLAQHRQPNQPLLREFPDGQWRRITERFLADGSMLSYSIDVTALVRQEQALRAAQRTAEQAVARLEDAIAALPAGFELFDADDRLVLYNARLAEMYPAIADMLPHRPSFEAMVRANEAAGGLTALGVPVDQWLAERHAQRKRGEFAPAVLGANGRWMRAHERRTRDGGIVGVRVDITAEVVQRQAAETATTRLREAIDALPDGFALFDSDDRLVLCNERYRALYRESGPALQIGARFEDLLRYGLAHGQFPQAAGRGEAWLAERLQAHRQPGPPLLQELPGNRWLRIDERRTPSGGVAGVRADVTTLVRREQELARINQALDAANSRLVEMAETDALTGIANRRALDRRLAEECARALRHGHALSLLMIDIDHFKAFNDAHGHAAGDTCLRQVAQVLASCVRRPGDLVARMGGEEFAVVLPHTGLTEARAQAARCLQAIDAACIAHGHAPTAAHVTLSIGVASTEGHTDAEATATDAAALLARADQAMYRAKHAGRHCIESA